MKFTFCLPALMSLAWTASAQTPATIVFDNSAAMRIRSDGNSSLYGNYPHLVNCVTNRVDNGGAYFFRTVTHSCVPAVQRYVVLDFSNRVGVPPASCTVDDAYGQEGTLNICGPNMLPDVRIIANKLFAKNFNGGTSLTLILSLVSGFFSGPGAFTVEFETNVGVAAGPTANTRIVTATSGMIAELYKNVPPNQGSRQSLGRYYLPFVATVTKTP
jgi:hypothetical protein